MISKHAYIGENVSIGEGVIIEDGVIIGDHVTIGHQTVIKKGTIVGDYSTIGNLTSLGRKPAANKNMVKHRESELPPLSIGKEVKIGDNCVLYSGTVILDDVFIGDLASIRENVIIGQQSVVGRQAIIENNTSIGNRVTIQTGCYLTAFMIIEDEVFFGPCCSTSNDKYMKSGGQDLKGPHVKKGAKLGNNSTLLPGVIIGENAIIGAGTTVVKDVSSQQTVVGIAGKPL